MKIEAYSDLYFLDVVKIIENFHKEAVCEYDEFFNPDSLIEAIKSADPNNAFLLIMDGVCQGLLYGQRFVSATSGKTIFQEAVWYVNKPFRGSGLILLKEAEKMLKSQGVGIIIMAVLENSKTEKIKTFYQRLGFKPMETHYVRSL